MLLLLSFALGTNVTPMLRPEAANGDDEDGGDGKLLLMLFLALADSIT